MLPKSILGISVLWILFPLPVRAFPSDSQITQAAQRICNTPRNSSESLESIFLRSIRGEDGCMIKPLALKRLEMKINKIIYMI